MSISVFLLDDHEIVRRGIAQLLETEGDIEVIGEAATAAQAMARIPALRPDVAILDVRLPDGEGVSVCRDVRPPSHRPACLILTSYLDDEALFGAIIAGASGYLLKQVAGVDLIGAIRTVAGGSLLDPQATAVVLKRLRTGDEPNDAQVCLAQPTGTTDPAHRRWAHQPADRCRDVPGREDRQELRVLAAAQARLRPPNRGGRVCHRAAPFRSHRSPLIPIAEPMITALAPASSAGYRRVARDAPSARLRTRAPLLEVPQAAARPDKPVPIPLSTTSIRRSSPASTATVTAVAPLCRTALLTASRTTASACTPTSGRTSVSTAPTNRTDGERSLPAAASAAVSSNQRRNPPSVPFTGGVQVEYG